MTHPALPLTPANSTEILGKETVQSPSHEPSFHLPSPALTQSRDRRGSSNSHRSVRPATTLNYALPPPPTRPRQIIHMNPESPASHDVSAQSGQSTTNRNRNLKPDSKSNTAGKKRKPNAANAAGRKTARKTAHSVIERRRRSKMNEEFGTLKDMIPACKGQEMHKLAILQVRTAPRPS